MILSKSCEQKYNIRHGTIKIGTLHDYQTTESQQIKDAGEGTLELNLFINEAVDLDPVLFNTLFGKTLYCGDDTSASLIDFPGRSYVSSEVLVFEHTNESKVRVHKSQTRIKRTAPNSFVFCMSQCRRLNDWQGIFRDYDDCWHVTAASAKAFGIAIGRLLVSHIEEERLKGNPIIPGIECMDEVKMYMSHGPVLYTPREIHITQHHLLELHDLVSKMRTMSHIKPVIYSTEKEYRFQYTFVLNGKILPPLVKSVIFDSDLLKHFVI